MVNGELERDRKDRITGWEGIEKGPDVLEASDAEDDESSISENDIEYFKKNPKELSDLVAGLVKLRGGADAIKEGATWDKDMRAYVGADGLPRDWAHLTGYLKRNPDAIGQVLKEYNELQAADDDEGDAEAALGGAEAVPAPAVDAAAEVAPAEAEVTEIVEDAKVIENKVTTETNNGVASEAPVEREEKVIDFVKAKEKTGSERLSNSEAISRIDELDGGIDGIKDFHDQSSVWEAMKRTLDGCDDGVKVQVEYMRAEQSLKKSQDFLAQKKAELGKMPLFTFPWSKRRREKDSLKYIIASTTKSLSYQSGKLDELAKNLPESISDDDKELVAKFRELDARMDRSNSDLHVRGLGRDIRMRQNWIRDQENSMRKSSQAGEKTINDPGEAARREAIQRWQDEIAELQAHIDDYSREHPDFVMDPTKKPKSESLDKAA